MADMTVQQIITQALLNVGTYSPGETLKDAELQDGLLRLRSMIRAWNAQGQMVHFSTQDTHTLTSGTASYTIGSTGTIATGRPVSIKNGYIRTSDNIDTPLKIIDEAKYQGLGNKNLGYTYPAYLWYNPTYPNGTIYLYPPGGGELYINSLKELSDPTTLTGDVAFPGPYDEAMEWGLTTRLCPSNGREPTPFMYDMAKQAEDNIIALNAALSVESISPEILHLTRRYHIDSDT